MQIVNGLLPVLSNRLENMAVFSVKFGYQEFESSLSLCCNIN
uniref:Uncharacterized protein n=1 Tax=Rhizophora mucronata TaxID=61149 RepID=A0A2P2P2L8_RHIMU